MRRTPALLFAVLVIVLYVTGCSKAESPKPKTEDPVINSIYPKIAKGGDTITALGAHLPTDVSAIRISVNDKSAKIISATPDSLQAIVPALAGSGRVMLSVGAASFNGPLITYQYEAIVTTVAGDGTTGNGDGQPTSASFNCPWGIAADAQNNLFIADTYNRLIRKISAADHDVSTFDIPSNPDSLGFASPYNLAIHPVTHDLYVTDFNAHLMRMDTSGNATVIYIAAQPLAGVALSPDGSHVFVGNNTAGTITKMDADGANATLFAQGLITPRNILYNNEGKMLVAAYPGPIYLLTPDGDVRAVTNELPGFGGWEFTTDSLGNFFLADHFSNCIRIIDKNGNTSVIAGSGDAEDKDGTGLAASFNGPQGITIDRNGYLYVTTYNYDTKGGNKVRRIELR